MIIELTVPTEAVEEVLTSRHQLEDPAKLTHIEHDELSDVWVLMFEVNELDVPKIDRGWDADDFAAGLIEESI